MTSNFSDNEVVTIQLGRYHALLKQLEEKNENPCKDLEQRFEALRDQNKRLFDDLERIGEILTTDDAAEFQNWEDMYKQKADQINEIIGG